MGFRITLMVRTPTASASISQEPATCATSRRGKSPIIDDNKKESLLKYLPPTLASWTRPACPAISVSSPARPKARRSAIGPSARKAPGCSARTRIPRSDAHALARRLRDMPPPRRLTRRGRGEKKVGALQRFPSLPLREGGGPGWGFFERSVNRDTTRRQGHGETGSARARPSPARRCCR